MSNISFERYHFIQNNTILIVVLYFLRDWNKQFCFTSTKRFLITKRSVCLCYRTNLPYQIKYAEIISYITYTNSFLLPIAIFEQKMVSTFFLKYENWDQKLYLRILIVIFLLIVKVWGTLMCDCPVNAITPVSYDTDTCPSHQWLVFGKVCNHINDFF